MVTFCPLHNIRCAGRKRAPGEAWAEPNRSAGRNWNHQSLFNPKPMISVAAIRMQQFGVHFYQASLSASDIDKLVRFEVLSYGEQAQPVSGGRKKAPACQPEQGQLGSARTAHRSPPPTGQPTLFVASLRAMSRQRRTLFLALLGAGLSCDIVAVPLFLALHNADPNTVPGWPVNTGSWLLYIAGVLLFAGAWVMWERSVPAAVVGPQESPAVSLHERGDGRFCACRLPGWSG